MAVVYDGPSGFWLRSKARRVFFLSLRLGTMAAALL